MENELDSDSQCPDVRNEALCSFASIWNSIHRRGLNSCPPAGEVLDFSSVRFSGSASTDPTYELPVNNEGLTENADLNAVAFGDVHSARFGPKNSWEWEFKRQKKKIFYRISSPSNGSKIIHSCWQKWNWEDHPALQKILDVIEMQLVIPSSTHFLRLF